MATTPNPVLNGIFRAVQLASTIQNMNSRQQQQQSLDQYRQALEAHRAQTAARQAQEDQRRAGERAFERELDLAAKGFKPLSEGLLGQIGAAGRGEQFPALGMGPDGVMAAVPEPEFDVGEGISEPMAQGTLLRTPEGRAFGKPSAGALDKRDRRKRTRQIIEDEQVRQSVATPPLPARVTDDEGNVNFLDPRTGNVIATTRGVAKKSRARLGETAAQKRARLNFERSIANETQSKKVSSWANRIVDENGDVDAALADVARQARFNPFVRDHRVAITSEIKKARTQQQDSEALRTLKLIFGEEGAEQLGLSGAEPASSGSASGNSQAQAEAKAFLDRFRKKKK